jgi:hypothetical protein
LASPARRATLSSNRSTTATVFSRQRGIAIKRQLVWFRCASAWSTDRGLALPTFWRGGLALVEGHRGQRYAIEMCNETRDGSRRSRPSTDST